MAQITPEQFKKSIADKIRSLNIAKTIVFPVATIMLDSMRQRLFQEGISGDGSKTGSYSTTPIYASKSSFVGGGFSPQGKNAKKTASGKLSKGSKNKKDGAQRKSMYLADGYKQLRQVQGKETAFVNLQYSGLLFTDFSKLAVEKDTVVSKVGTRESSDKLKWLSDKYGKDTFKHTKQEREFFKKEISKQLIKYLRS
jgi:hypothetical protein